MADFHKNAVVRDMDSLLVQWREFRAKKGRRFLRWVCPDDALSVLRGFFEGYHGLDGTEPDHFFLTFNEPFTTGAHYGKSLQKGLLQQYADSKDDLEELEIAADWTPPTPKRGMTGLHQFVEAAGSFRDHYREEFETLVVILEPSEIEGPKDWAIFVEDLCRLRSNPEVLFVFPEAVSTPHLEGVVKRHADVFVTKKAPLDMPATIANLVNEAGGTGPGKDFRDGFVAAALAASKGATPDFMRKAKAALAVAEKNAWHPQIFTMHALVASAQLASGKVDQAVAAYRKAGEAATASMKSTDPAVAEVGKKLAVQSKVGEAAALTSVGKFGSAAASYAAAVPLAREAKDPIMELETLRCQAFCLEQDGKHAAAWTAYLAAIGVGEGMEPDQRAASTLPFVGQGMLRIVQGPKKVLGVIPRSNRFGNRGAAVEKRMTELLGPQWKDALPPEA